MQRVATRNPRRAVVVLVGHVQRGVAEDIADDVRVVWVQFSNRGRCDVPEGVRAQREAQVAFCDLGQLSREAVGRNPFAVLVDPERIGVLAVEQNMPMLFKICTHRRGEDGGQAEAAGFAVFHVLGCEVQRIAIGDGSNMVINGHGQQGATPDGTTDQEADHQRLPETDRPRHGRLTSVRLCVCHERQGAAQDFRSHDGIGCWQAVPIGGVRQPSDACVQPPPISCWCHALRHHVEIGDVVPNGGRCQIAIFHFRNEGAHAHLRDPMHGINRNGRAICPDQKRQPLAVALRAHLAAACGPVPARAAIIEQATVSEQ